MHIQRMVMVCLAALWGGVSAGGDLGQHSMLAGVLLAQNPANDSAAAPDKADDAEDEALPPAAPRKLEGDVIRMKNGSIISGVQVIRVTPRAVVIQVHPNLDPLEVPRRQVENIEYDNLDPSRAKQGGELSPPTQPDIIVGEELAPDFYRKLTAPLSDSALSFENTDCIEMLANLAQRAGVTIEIADALRALPNEERVRSIEIPANTSLLSFLQDKFLKTYSTLKVLYPYDKAVVTTKAATETPPLQAPPQEEAPAPPPLAVPPNAQ